MDNLIKIQKHFERIHELRNHFIASIIDFENKAGYPKIMCGIPFPVCYVMNYLWENGF